MLRAAASIASHMRRKAGSPSINGRTLFPVRTGYEEEPTNGMAVFDIGVRGSAIQAF